MNKQVCESNGWMSEGETSECVHRGVDWLAGDLFRVCVCVCVCWAEHRVCNRYEWVCVERSSEFMKKLLLCLFRLSVRPPEHKLDQWSFVRLWSVCVCVCVSVCAPRCKWPPGVTDGAGWSTHTHTHTVEFLLNIYHPFHFSWRLPVHGSHWWMCERTCVTERF